MSSPLRRALPVALLAAVVIPSSAAASSTSVSSHAKRSRAAAAHIATEVRDGDRAGALATLRRSRREAAAAARVARRHAARKPGSLGAANAARLVATTYDANLAQYVALIPQVDEIVATALAQALAPTLNGREHAIAILNSILPLLPDAARPPIAEIIAALRADNPQDVAGLGAILQSAAVPVDVKGIVTGVFAAASAIAESSLAQVSALLPLLPEAARGPVESALGIVTGQLGMVQDLVEQVLGLVETLPGAGLGGLLAGGARP